VWFVVAAVFTFAYLTAVIKTAGVPGASRALVIASQFLRFFVLASVTLWLLALFHDRLDSGAAFWKDLAANSYNIYLIHMTVLVVFQMLVLSLPLPSTLKFLIVSLLTVLVSWLAGRFIVNRSGAGAVAFVMLIFLILSVAA
jgi:membrane-bound acyltransferase YfiQ involved in biofilm formation